MSALQGTTSDVREERNTIDVEVWVLSRWRRHRRIYFLLSTTLP